MAPAFPVFLVLSLILAPRAVDLGTYKGCAADDGQFKQTQLWKGPTVGVTAVSNGGLKMAFARQPNGTVDVYFTQKQGSVRRYNAKDGTVDSLGRLGVDFMGEYGLVGIAAREDFGAAPWLYLYGSYLKPDSSPVLRLSRIKLNGALAALDMATEKVLLEFPRAKSTFHSAGDMHFDAYGDLWLAVGDNGQTETGPGNTADLRGSVLRIHPDESAQGYKIPKGNFAEVYSAYWKEKGRADLATQYADPAKVRPEIYVKGNRNPYTISLDPVKRWLAWGDVGPDQGRISEEHNLVKAPGFMGWPYFAGEQDVAGQNPYGAKVPAGSTRAAPVNSLPAAGVKELPPNQEPIFARQQGCAMNGPIFRYDGRLTNAGQFPPQLNGKWLISGCDSYGYHLMTLDADAAKIQSNVAVFNTMKPVVLVDLNQGPDGLMYSMSWHLGLFKLEYTGACKDPALVPERTGCATPGAPGYDATVNPAYHDPRMCGATGLRAASAARADWLRADAGALAINAGGPHTLILEDLAGREVARWRGMGPMSYAWPTVPAGVYTVRAESGLGTAARTLPRL